MGTFLRHSVEKSNITDRPIVWPLPKNDNDLLYSFQFNSNCPTLTPKVTGGKKLSQRGERVFKQKRFQFTLENVIKCVISWIAWGRPFQALGPAWENSVRQTSAELSVVHNGEYWQIWDGFCKGYSRYRSGNEIRQIRWVIAGIYKAHQNRYL